MELKWYRHFIGMEEDDLCEGCGVSETIEHVLCHCWSTQAARRKHWGGAVGIGMLTSHTETCRRILSAVYGQLSLSEAAENTLCAGPQTSGVGQASLDE